MEPMQDAHELQGYLRRLIFNIIPNLVPGDIITIARESQGPSPSYSFQHKKRKKTHCVRACTFKYWTCLVHLFRPTHLARALAYFEHLNTQWSGTELHRGPGAIN